MEAYYYQHMTRPWQAAYHAMKTGFTTLSSSFSVPRLENKELSTIFFQLRLDCPEIFYVTGFTYRFVPGAENVELLPEYLFDKSKIKGHQKALAARVEKLARPAKNMTALEKERYIHDFICQNVRYDKLKKPYSHEIIGPLGQGVGVCEGISKSVKILCDALGLWCIIAVSLSHDGVIRYDYFNLDDKRLFRDHQPVIYPTPACAASDRFYYREAKLSFTKVEDVVKRAQMAIRKDMPFVFHWRGGPFTRDVLLQLVQALEEAAQKRNRHAAVSFNRSQAVLQVRFPTELPGEAAEEDANEGEQYEGV